MMYEKGLIQSKTIIGLIVLLFGVVLGWSPEMQEAFGADLAEIAELGSVLVGAVLTVYGRYKARGPITGVYNGANKNVPMALFLPLILAGALTLQSCAAMMPVTPESTNEGIAVARAEYSAILRTATDLRRAGVIDDELATKMADRFDTVETMLDLAQGSAIAGRLDEANTQLDLAINLIALIQKEVDFE